MSNRPPVRRTPRLLTAYALMAIAWPAILLFSSSSLAGVVISRDNDLREYYQGGAFSVQEHGETVFAWDGNKETALFVDRPSRTWSLAGRAEIAQTLRDRVQELNRTVDLQGLEGLLGKMKAPTYAYRKVGSGGVWAGQATDLYEVATGGRPVARVWIAPGVVIAKEVDISRLKAVLDEARVAAGGLLDIFLTGNPFYLNLPLLAAGYPLRNQELISKQQGIMEAVDIQRVTIPAQRFQPPSGFTEIPLKKMLGKIL